MKTPHSKALEKAKDGKKIKPRKVGIYHPDFIKDVVRKMKD